MPSEVADAAGGEELDGAISVEPPCDRIDDATDELPEGDSASSASVPAGKGAPGAVADEDPRDDGVDDGSHLPAPGNRSVCTRREAANEAPASDPEGSRERKRAGWHESYFNAEREGAEDDEQVDDEHEVVGAGEPTAFWSQPSSGWGCYSQDADGDGWYQQQHHYHQQQQYAYSGCHHQWPTSFVQTPHYYHYGHHSGEGKPHGEHRASSCREEGAAEAPSGGDDERTGHGDRVSGLGKSDQADGAGDNDGKSNGEAAHQTFPSTWSEGTVASVHYPGFNWHSNAWTSSHRPIVHQPRLQWQMDLLKWPAKSQPLADAREATRLIAKELREQGKKPKWCIRPGCKERIQVGDYCYFHGLSNLCSFRGCGMAIEKGGLCRKHCLSREEGRRVTDRCKGLNEEAKLALSSKQQHSRDDNCASNNLADSMSGAVDEQESGANERSSDLGNDSAHSLEDDEGSDEAATVNDAKLPPDMRTTTAAPSKPGSEVQNADDNNDSRGSSEMDAYAQISATTLTPGYYSPPQRDGLPQHTHHQHQHYNQQWSSAQTPCFYYHPSTAIQHSPYYAYSPSQYHHAQQPANTVVYVYHQPHSLIQTQLGEAANVGDKSGTEEPRLLNDAAPQARTSETATNTTFDYTVAGYADSETGSKIDTFLRLRGIAGTCIAKGCAEASLRDCNGYCFGCSRAAKKELAYRKCAGQLRDQLKKAKRAQSSTAEPPAEPTDSLMKDHRPQKRLEAQRVARGHVPAAVAMADAARKRGWGCLNTAASVSRKNETEMSVEPPPTKKVKVNPTRIDEKWQRNFDELSEYYREHGAGAPLSRKTDKKVAKWSV